MNVFQYKSYLTILREYFSGNLAWSVKGNSSSVQVCCGGGIVTEIVYVTQDMIRLTISYPTNQILTKSNRLG